MFLVRSESKQSEAGGARPFPPFSSSRASEPTRPAATEPAAASRFKLCPKVEKRRSQVRTYETADRGGISVFISCSFSFLFLTFFKIFFESQVWQNGLLQMAMLRGLLPGIPRWSLLVLFCSIPQEAEEDKQDKRKTGFLARPLQRQIAVMPTAPPESLRTFVVPRPRENKSHVSFSRKTKKKLRRDRTHYARRHFLFFFLFSLLTLEGLNEWGGRVLLLGYQIKRHSISLPLKKCTCSVCASSVLHSDGEIVSAEKT